MCPTFLATGEEIMSTRGRANIIRAALELRVNGHDPLKSAELDAALSNCLSCKGCTPECPSNVNLALLKAEMMYARHRRDGLPLRERILSNVDLLGRIGCAMPSLANAIVDLKPMRLLMEKTIGISAKRSLPHYAQERFDRWFARRTPEGPASAGPGRAEARPSDRRGRVILWDDTFVRYHEPHIGIAAVKVLEALGFEVELIQNRRCCGRPAFSQGNLDAAAELGKHNVDLLSNVSPVEDSRWRVRTSTSQSAPILFLEPSCYSMFVEDYRELKIENAEEVAKRCFLFEKFVDDLLVREPDAFRFKHRGGERRDPCALPRQVADESGIHVTIGRAIARTKSDRARHRLLRNGRRVRRADGEIRFISSSSRAHDRQDRQSTTRDRDRRFGNKLPASDCRSYQHAAQTHGRVVSGSDRLALRLRRALTLCPLSVKSMQFYSDPYSFYATAQSI